MRASRCLDILEANTILKILRLEINERCIQFLLEYYQQSIRLQSPQHQHIRLIIYRVSTISYTLLSLYNTVYQIRHVLVKHYCVDVLPFEMILNPYLTWLQYGVIHRCIAANICMYTFGVTQSTSYSVCAKTIIYFSVNVVTLEGSNTM